MTCPNCTGRLVCRDTVLIDDGIARFRKCESCGQSFYTFESIASGDEANALRSQIHKRAAERSKKSQMLAKGLEYAEPEIDVASSRQKSLFTL